MDLSNELIIWFHYPINLHPDIIRLLWDSLNTSSVLNCLAAFHLIFLILLCILFILFIKYIKEKTLISYGNFSFTKTVQKVTPIEFNLKEEKIEKKEGIDGTYQEN